METACPVPQVMWNTQPGLGGPGLNSLRSLRPFLALRLENRCLCALQPGCSDLMMGASGRGPSTRTVRPGPAEKGEAQAAWLSPRDVVTFSKVKETEAWLTADTNCSGRKGAEKSLCGLLIASTASLPQAWGTPQKSSRKSINIKQSLELQMPGTQLPWQIFHKQNLSFTVKQALELIHTKKSWTWKLESVLFHRMCEVGGLQHFPSYPSEVSIESHSTAEKPCLVLYPQLNTYSHHTPVPTKLSKQDV